MTGGPPKLDKEKGVTNYTNFHEREVVKMRAQSGVKRAARGESIEPPGGPVG